MSALFNRFISLKVGEPGKSGKLISGLKIEIEIDKNEKSDANTGKISVYNLNEDSLNLILDSSSIFILKAGYLGLNEEDKNIAELSSGDIEDVVTKKSGTDIITTFSTSESGKKLREKTIDKSFGIGVSKKIIIDELVKGLGVIKGAIKGIEDKFFNSGYSASGKIKDHMDILTKENNLKWSIQNNELQILPENESTFEEAVVLTYKTGLLKAYKTKKEGNDKIFFEALLNPQIKIGRLVVINGKNVSGTFKVVQIKYIGDNRAGKFICKGEIK